ncbi:MAG: glutamate racemase [Eubacteriales bacterium]|nr:glutamate racemase [Eubacteriales bacterium]MDD4323983.1 glutamate racemase [Eubacteriales bacterium]MDD4541324.1 glutamate racemase [Eubacteriales bacterium]
MPEYNNAADKAAPIGVFDSGLGGLTVLRELMALLPQEDFLYLADNANAPYGRNSPAKVRRDTLNNVDFFIQHGVKMIIFACNTSSAIALEAADERAGSIPVIGVIKAGIIAAMEVSGDLKAPAKIAVLATEATVNNGVFSRELPRVFAENDLPEPIVIQQACQDFVQVVEDGKWDDPLADDMAEHYLGEMRTSENPDLAILACTHFPFLENSIQKALPDSELVDCSKALALEVKELLLSFNLHNEKKHDSELKFFVTEDTSGIKQNIERILDIEIERVHHVDIKNAEEFER